ncbi:MAG: ABC transporter permease [Cyclobacteriaceae bacterium]
MLLNYLKLATRLLIRNPFFTFINLVGLSVGFAVFIVLWQYSLQELKSDQFHKDWDRIYKLCVIGRWTDDGTNWQESLFGFSPYGMNGVLRKYSGIIDETQYFAQKLFSKKHGFDHDAEVFFSHVDANDRRQIFLETKVIYAEPNFFNFFSFPFVTGDPGNALSPPHAVVISEKTSKKYFGNDNPLGKTLLLYDTIPLQVTGVFKNLPTNTHLDFDIVISTERIRYNLDKLTGGEWVFAFSYFKFSRETNVPALQQRINISSKAEIKKQAWGDWGHGTAEILLKPLKDVPFEIDRFDIHKPRSKYLLLLFAASSFIILAMAWINYINLAVSWRNKRMKELAARKTIGARTIDLIYQYILEASIVNIMSFLLALTLVQLFKSPAHMYLQFHIQSWEMIPLSTWIVIASALSVGILLTGLYPALITLKRSPKSLFQPALTKSSENYITGVLSTAQFSTAIALIVWIFALQNQISFITRKNIGLNDSHVLIIDLPVSPTKTFYKDIDQLKQKASALSVIKGYTVSHNVSVDVVGGMIGLQLAAGKPGIQVDCNGGVDENFLPFYGIKLLAGRNFAGNRPSDSSSILISRGTMYRLGIEKPEDAIGRHLNWPRAEIIGVFEDYTLRPLIKGDDFRYGGIPGIALTYKDFLPLDKRPKKISLRVAPANFDQTITDLKTIFNSVFPADVFNWYFLDDQINSQYQSDMTARNQMLFFSILTVGIACLGLLGVISNKLVARLKEIGIRKVVGAQLHDITWILLNSTVKQLVIATTIGLIAGYYLSEEYLQKFSERITLQWWHFAMPVLLLILIMFATVVSVLIKAVRTNPVDALRYE